MIKNITKVFGLQGVILDQIEILEKSKETILHCRSPRVFCVCPICGHSSKQTHQVKYRLIRHERIGGNQVIIKLKVRRFKCSDKKNCRKIFTESFPGVNRKRTTKNFRLEVLNWLTRNSFNFVGYQFNISSATLTRYLLELSDDWKNIDWDKLKTTRLGIDEHSFRGRHLVITITDLDNRKLLAILIDDRKRTLEKFLQNIPESAKNRLIEVCIDLKQSYKDSIKKLLPQANVVADRFHVQELAKRNLEAIRQIVQDERGGRKNHLKQILLANRERLTHQEKNKLENIFKAYEKFPILREAYIIKETVRTMYNCRDRAKAEEKFKHIIMLLQTIHHSRYLDVMLGTLKRWKPEILNYFDYRTTNGFTEGCHTKIKMIKRVSFGFRNINNYIAKMTLAFIPLVWLINHHTI